MIPKKIKELLDSDSIESVRLGVILLQEVSSDEDLWNNLLAKCSLKCVNSIFSDDYGTDIYIRKWWWVRDGKEITIQEAKFFKE